MLNRRTTKRRAVGVASVRKALQILRLYPGDTGHHGERSRSPPGNPQEHRP